MSRAPEEQAELAAVQAAVARGLIGGEQLREALLLREEISRRGQPCPILHLLRARWLPPDALPWLREVYRRSLREAQGKPPGRARAESDRLDSQWDSIPPTIPPGLIVLGQQLAQKDPAEDPAAVQEFLGASLGRPADHEAPTAPRGSERLLRLATVRQVGRYQVVRELARGGMGVVFVARDPELGREVALKVLKPFAAEDAAEEVERFKREARAMARMHHPNVVAVHDAGCDGDVPFLVMELVQGQSLKELIKARGLLDAKEAAGLGAKVARALQHAHEQGVLHRDVKPANVLVKADGEPLLVDFGLARGKAVSATGRLTRTGEVLGTPLYMAPEQARGDLERIDPRTDVYSLGATLYHALTGRTPFQGADTLSVFASIATELPASIQQQLPGFDSELEAIVLRCLAKAREERPQSARDLAESLERWASAAPDGPPRRPATAAAPSGMSGVAIGLALVALGSAAAVVIVMGGAPPPPAGGTVAHVATAAQRPEEPPPAASPFEAALAEGKAAALRKEWPAAEQALARAVELGPDHADAQAHLGWARIMLGKADQALGPLDRALELDPRCALAWAKRGLVRSYLGQWRQGLTDIDAALALRPADAESHFNRAVVLRMLDSPGDDVLRALDRALSCSPSPELAAAVHLQRAYALQASGQLADARAAAGTARELAGAEGGQTRELAEQLLQQLGEQR